MIAWWVKQGKPHPRIGTKHSEETKEKMSKAKEGYIPWNVGRYGKDSPNWKGGSSSWYHYEAHRVWEEYWGEPVPYGYFIHHIDFDYTNNDITNLTAMKRGKHNWLHKRRNYNYSLC